MFWKRVIQNQLWNYFIKAFPAGFLQEPFIGMGLKALDYGALGSVVGHELTHGFDTMGEMRNRILHFKELIYLIDSLFRELREI